MAEIIERVVATGDVEADSQVGLSVDTQADNPGFLTQEQIDAREAVAAKYLLGHTQGNVAAVRQEGETLLLRRIEVSDESAKAGDVVTVNSDEYAARERERIEGATAPSDQPTSEIRQADDKTDEQPDGEATKNLADDVKEFSVTAPEAAAESEERIITPGGSEKISDEQ